MYCAFFSPKSTVVFEESSLTPQAVIKTLLFLLIDFLFSFTDEKLNEIGVNTHIMPGLYILLDVAVSATPRRLLHAYQPSMFLTVYTLFNFTYYLCGGLVCIVYMSLDH